MTNQEHARQLITDALQLAHGAVRGATFKARYLRQLKPDFDERDLGYRTLRAFLEAFPDVVRVEHDGMDIVVQPATESARAHVESRDLKRVRPDFWRAFTFVDANVNRYFDRVNETAVLLGKVPASTEPQRLREVRRRMEEAPGDFIPIDPVESATQLQEMRRFAANVSDRKVGNELDEALKAVVWFRAFTAVLNRVPGLLHDWKMQWSDFVFQRIIEWRDAHQLSVPNLIVGTIRVPVDSIAPPRAPKNKQLPTAGGQHIDIDINELRARVIRAVTWMSAAQLLALPIPIEHLFRND